MVYELRIYTPSPGRLADLLHRFETITTECWAALGIVVAGFWVTDPADGPEQVVYLLRWESREQQAAVWPTFLKDPDWVARRAVTERNGTLVASITGSFMSPTRFSPLQ